MAIEIVPKPKSRAKEEISIFDIIYYFAVVLLLGSIAFFFYLYFADKSLQSRISEIDLLIGQKENAETKKLDEKIFDLGARVSVFGKLFEEYKKTSPFFELFSSLCHKKAYFSEMRLETQEGKAILVGVAESFQALEEQILIFKDEKMVKKVELSDLSVKETGGIGFGLSLEFDEETFKQAKQ